MQAETLLEGVPLGVVIDTDWWGFGGIALRRLRFPDLRGWWSHEANCGCMVQ